MFRLSNLALETAKIAIQATTVLLEQRNNSCAHQAITAAPLLLTQPNVMEELTIQLTRELALDLVRLAQEVTIAQQALLRQSNVQPVSSVPVALICNNLAHLQPQLTSAMLEPTQEGSLSLLRVTA